MKMADRGYMAAILNICKLDEVCHYIIQSTLDRQLWFCSYLDEVIIKKHVNLVSYMYIGIKPCFKGIMQKYDNIMLSKEKNSERYTLIMNDICLKAHFCWFYINYESEQAKCSSPRYITVAILSLCKLDGRHLGFLNGQSDEFA